MEKKKEKDRLPQKQDGNHIKAILSGAIQAMFSKAGIIVGCIILFLIFYGGIRLGKFLYGTDLTGSETQITEHLLRQQLEQTGELATVKYFYTDMGQFENSLQLGNTNIPFTKKSFIISYDGVIKAGINMDQIKMDLDGKTLRITLPKATILSHEVDQDSVTVYDERHSIFNGLDTKDVIEFQKNQKAAMEERAIENGLLKEAQDNAKKRLKELYGTILHIGEQEDNPYTLEILDE